jgi:hypothetical protein
MEPRNPIPKQTYSVPSVHVFDSTVHFLTACRRDKPFAASFFLTPSLFYRQFGQIVRLMNTSQYQAKPRH